MKRNSSALRSIPNATLGRSQVPAAMAIARLEQERARLEKERAVWRAHESRVNGRIQAVDAQLAQLRDEQPVEKKRPAAAPAAPSAPADPHGGMVFEY
ncbi:MAG: hypothetical protein EI684_22210 [Candidatus Viridilinea halotolerans]|uniref:Uncharacterized protein n=1 Tax=Candidatus Viridilinea halotolerans TaxID=2491704 RepID=A0A426TQY4_9CHLR|nr:MAG: hypothetical protein EI684_22210 [Candidatus Viridilinea halotolerans]